MAKKEVLNHADLAEMVLKVKNEVGVTYKKMAEKIGMSDSYFSKWRNGERPLPEEKVNALKGVLEELLR